MKLIEFVSIAQELVKKQAEELNSGNLGLKEVEERIVMLVNQIGHELLQMTIDQVIEPTHENAINVQGLSARYRATDTITLQDRFGGELEISRRRYGLKGGGSIYPLDDRLGLTQCHGFTPLMTYLQAFFGACDPYAHAAERLSAATGTPVSATALENNTEKTGARIESRPIHSIKGRLGSCEVMIIGTDGTMSPQIKQEEGLTGRESLKMPTEYKECNVGIIEKWLQGELIDRWIGAQYGPRSQFESYVREAGIKMGKHQAQEIVFIADGAKHNWAFCSSHFKTATQILDFYHATEHVAAFCELYGSDEFLKKAKFLCLKELLYEGQILTALGDMRADLKLSKSDSDREAAQKEINYFETNKDRMAYDRYRKRGFPIGSGLIESACKLVVGKRFKGNGMRWKKQDNQNTLNTRLAVMNNTLSAEFMRKPDRWSLKVG